MAAVAVVAVVAAAEVSWYSLFSKLTVVQHTHTHTHACMYYAYCSLPASITPIEVLPLTDD